ncbi:hypothetical protein BRD00_13975 [Halobacteriales archaeon QS_8_69_26]|nr:MAG: hypothetical protein BRD00_13975 [Halobacteriales archaeon QS_8_69_26]
MDEETEDREKADELREIFMTVSGDGTVTEHQEEGPSYEAVDGTDDGTDEVESATEAALDEAIEGAEAPKPGVPADGAV